MTRRIRQWLIWHNRGASLKVHAATNNTLCSEPTEHRPLRF
ncbi:hypothetical protein [Rheinheimera sp. UJ63]|nr:hypothetical protein [Rheinheimera sp. UJ63]